MKFEVSIINVLESESFNNFDSYCSLLDAGFWKKLLDSVAEIDSSVFLRLSFSEARSIVVAYYDYLKLSNDISGAE